ncbi:MAG TPA: cysteine desulfurase [Clostridiales bacterium]|nr:cysteine desulfurase [Clostridiales bacterium]
MIYLDSAATTLEKPPSVARAVARAIGTIASPGRGGHQPGMAAAELMYRCRELAADLFQAPDPDHVVLTNNATHGLNLAIHALVRRGSRVLISGYEHNAVTRPLAARQAEVVVAAAPLFQSAQSYQAFAHHLEQGVDVVVCNHVSNVFGWRQPVEEIAQLCRRYGVPLIVDASQSAGILPIRCAAWGAAFVAMPGHKGLYGPQGTGLLLCGREGRPLLFGGTGSNSLSQEMPDFLPDRLEAGTPNVCGAAGLLEGMRFVKERGEAEIFRHERRLCQRMAQGLEGCKAIRTYTGPDQCGVLSFTAEGWDCEELAEQLGRQGIAVRAGLHCAPLAHRSAGTLERGTVRLSVSAFTRAWQVDQAVERIVALSR